MTSGERLRILAHEVRSPVAALDALAGGARGLSGSGLLRAVALAMGAGQDIERLLSDRDVLSLRHEEVQLDVLLGSFARPGVTCSAEEVSAICDPTKIRQAVANLVVNGLRHGTAVTVVGRHRDGWIEIEVTDDGPGIAAGSDIFERGVSGVGSSGYGLWLARGIAEAHGGQLTVDSTLAGATFTLVVPQRPSANG